MLRGPAPLPNHLSSNRQQTVYAEHDRAPARMSSRFEPTVLRAITLSVCAALFLRATCHAEELQKNTALATATPDFESLRVKGLIIALPGPQGIIDPDFAALGLVGVVAADAWPVMARGAGCLAVIPTICLNDITSGQWRASAIGVVNAAYFLAPSRSSGALRPARRPGCLPELKRQLSLNFGRSLQRMRQTGTAYLSIVI